MKCLKPTTDLETFDLLSLMALPSKWTLTVPTSPESMQENLPKEHIINNRCGHKPHLEMPPYRHGVTITYIHIYNIHVPKRFSCIYKQTKRNLSTRTKHDSSWYTSANKLCKHTKIIFMWHKYIDHNSQGRIFVNIYIPEQKCSSKTNQIFSVKYFT